MTRTRWPASDVKRSAMIEPALAGADDEESAIFPCLMSDRYDRSRQRGARLRASPRRFDPS